VPTTTKTVLPVARYTDLTRISPAFDIPERLLSAKLRMVSTEFSDPSLSCTLRVSQSMDGGATYTELASVEAVGGIDIKTGQPRQPSLAPDFTREQRDAALMKAEIQAQGSWRYGIDADLTT
jgi:hypothetical protein